MLVGEAALDENAALGSDSDTFHLAVVAVVANGLVSGGTFVQSRLDLFALMSK